MRDTVSLTLAVLVTFFALVGAEARTEPAGKWCTGTVFGRAVHGC